MPEPFNQEVSLDEIVKAILPILPHAQFGRDNEGQVVIYTNYYSYLHDKFWDPDFHA